jgi:hypothetical protein
MEADQLLLPHEWGGRGGMKLGKIEIRVGHLCLVKDYFTNIQNKMT